MKITDIGIDEDKVVMLSANYKAPPDGSYMLQPKSVPTGACSHWNTTFEVDIDAGKCICLGCKEEVTPFFVLESLMNKESRWMRTRAAYQDEMKRLEERSSTKCRSCGAMTRISQR